MESPRPRQTARLLRLTSRPLCYVSARPCWWKLKAAKLNTVVLLQDFYSLALSLVLAFSLAAASLIALTWLNARSGSAIVTRVVTGQAFKQKSHSVFLKLIASRRSHLLEIFFNFVFFFFLSKVNCIVLQPCRVRLWLQVSYATSTFKRYDTANEITNWDVEGTTKHEFKLHCSNKGAKYNIEVNIVQPLTDSTCPDGSYYLSSYTDSYSSLVKMSVFMSFFFPLLVYILNINCGLISRTLKGSI